MPTDNLESQNNNPDLSQLISLSAAAEIIGLSHSHLRLLIRRGDIWGKKLGRDWFTTPQSINDYLAQSHHPGPKPKINLE